MMWILTSITPSKHADKIVFEQVGCVEKSADYKKSSQIIKSRKKLRV